MITYKIQFEIFINNKNFIEIPNWITKEHGYLYYSYYLLNLPFILMILNFFINFLIYRSNNCIKDEIEMKLVNI